MAIEPTETALGGVYLITDLHCETTVGVATTYEPFVSEREHQNAAITDYFTIPNF